MRWIKILDLLGQTIVFMLIPAVVVISKGEQRLTGILGTQYAMGLWQMTSCSISLLFRGPAFKRKLNHFLISIAYLTLFFIVTTTTIMLGSESKLPMMIVGVLLFVPPWALAIYYYSITWQLVYPRYKKLSSFLPHINF